MKKRFVTAPLAHYYNASFNNGFQEPAARECSDLLRDCAGRIEKADGTYWGIPITFPVEGKDAIYAAKGTDIHCAFDTEKLEGEYLVFMHAADIQKPCYGDGFQYPFHGHPYLDEFLKRDAAKPYRGVPPLKDPVCSYVLTYADGTTETIHLEMRMQIGEWYNPMHQCFEAYPHIKAQSYDTISDEIQIFGKSSREYGYSLSRCNAAGAGLKPAPGVGDRPLLWLYAWKNPKPDVPIVSFEIKDVNRPVILAGFTACKTKKHPLRWETRRKLLVDIRAEIPGLSDADRQQILKEGIFLNKNIACTMGQIISVRPQLQYPEGEDWIRARQDLEPKTKYGCFLIEYTAHEDAEILFGNSKIALRELLQLPGVSIPADDTELRVRISDEDTGEQLAAKIHIHGEHGEYIPPRGKSRFPNPHWFQDYSADYVTEKRNCTYEYGDFTILAPKGRIYLEVTRGLEYQPLKMIYDVREPGRTIELKLKRVVDWRKKGWVSADTHVHFISPATAQLEGQAEGINVVNLMVLQDGDATRMAGDFDGHTVHGADTQTGKGEYLVRVGTENRQKMLGHLSLLGYDGPMIAPLVSGIPDEGQLGGPQDETQTGWAIQAHKQNGLVVLPHFSCPQQEAAAIVLGQIDAAEMVSWDDRNAGINPYAMSDWYRYLNCGYRLPVVGGSDKMSATTAIGTSRTYSMVHAGAYTYDEWKDSIRFGNTFATYGPLICFKANGRTMGEDLELPGGGAEVKIDWDLASVTLPVTKLELIVNGEIREMLDLDSFLGEKSGGFICKITEPSWIALRVRGQYENTPELIAAHTSPVSCLIDGVRRFSAENAQTVLDLIECTEKYIRDLAPKAEEPKYQQVMAYMEQARQKVLSQMKEAAAGK